MTQRKIMLIDGSSLAFRAFFSILDLNRFKNQSGLHTNALYSFNRMLDNVIGQFEPTHILVAFDQAGPTLRTQKYPDYKGGRAKTPSEFKEQMPYFRVLLDGYGIKYYDLADYEADDIIGTLAHQADANDEVVVISGDKDLIQLSNDNTTVYVTRRGVSELEAYTPEVIMEQYELTPSQIIDLKGLMGDSSDNYPGVTRIGEKTGIKLLKEFHSIPELYERIDELKPSKMKDNLVNERQQAFLSRELAEIETGIDLDIKIDDFEYQGKNYEALIDFYRQMDFNSFLSNIQEELGAPQLEELYADNVEFEVQEVATITEELLPQEAVVYFETLKPTYQTSEIIMVAWYDIEHQTAYVCEAETAFASSLFKEWLQDDQVKRIMFDSKREEVLAHRYGVSEIQGIDCDILIAAYLISSQSVNEIADVTRLFDLPITVGYDDDIFGKGAKRAIPEKQTLIQHVSTKVVALSLLKEPLIEQLNAMEMMDLYQEIDLPAARVLAKMEIVGIKVDGQTLVAKSEELAERLAEMEAEIHYLAGEEFNVNSPKQLGVVLFETLELPVIKKTKTGYSTSADVLEKLVDRHPIIQLILNYRQLNKLQGTYLEGLPTYIQEDGKIHTYFVQTLTQTGRLSSTDPNLQNIPIRIEEGRRIRQAFVPSQEGWQFFGADYSQIELRVLAHISGDPAMREAFKHGEDIHDATARAILHIDEDQVVTPNDRRQAKAVNFGIVYGISDYGLSQNLNIPRHQAKDFIDRYLDTYSGIHQFMQDIVQEAKEQGYVSTLYHRRRYLPDINSSNFNLRSFAERTALNSPIQGTAADIIKIAMIKLDQALVERGLQSRILLQVHDELILEGPAEEMEILSELVPEMMESAAELSIPLVVEYNQGNNWYEL